MKKALITGITGQDGSYLAELLLEKGYEVHGIIRRASSFNTGRIDHIYQDPHESGKRLFLHYGDLTDSTNLIRTIKEVEPDEIYNPAAQSHVKVSFETPEYTGNSDALGTLRILEAIMIRKFHNAKLENKPSVTMWGTGSAKREFLHVDDLAQACLFLMDNYNDTAIINIGTGEEVSIKELAEKVKIVVGYEGEMVWDTTKGSSTNNLPIFISDLHISYSKNPSTYLDMPQDFSNMICANLSENRACYLRKSPKPDGTPRKLLDVSKLHALGWKHQIPLNEGIPSTYEWFKKNYE